MPPLVEATVPGDLAPAALYQVQKDSSLSSLIEALADQYLAKKIKPELKSLLQKQKTGRQCRSTYALQVDHKTSRWASEDHSIENLQVLCFYHNQFKYQKESKIRTV
ncbi:MAG: HNH endonuclease [Bdellovibrio sp.]